MMFLKKPWRDVGESLALRPEAKKEVHTGSDLSERTVFVGVM